MIAASFRRRSACIVLASILCLAAASAALADPPRHGRRGYWEYDGRYRHDHYYPVRGSVFVNIPPNYLRVGYGHDTFLFSSGIWYRPHGPRYVVVAPPPGILVPALPPYYTVVMVGGAPYYYANTVYYQAAPGGYVVVPPPQGPVAVVAAPPPQPVPAAQEAPPATARAAGERLFVYPRNGQGPKKIEADKAECRRWAVDQTGFDPDQESAGDGLLDEFRRAQSACLEGRGYTVR